MCPIINVAYSIVLFKEVEVVLNRKNIPPSIAGAVEVDNQDRNEREEDNEANTHDLNLFEDLNIV